MYKLANQVLDFYDDIDKSTLKKVAKLAPKDLSIASDEHVASLKDRDFALTVLTKHASKLNKFPIDSRDSALLSNLYFGETYFRLPKTAAAVAAHHIKKACAKFKIEPTSPVEKLAAPSCSSNVYAEEDIPTQSVTRVNHLGGLDEMAEAEKIATNYTFAQYAFKTPSHVKVACEYFDKFASQMPVDIRHGYAAAIQKRAAELGMPPQKGTVCKYASDEYSGQVMAHIISRKSLLGAQVPMYSQALDKLAAAKNSMTPSEFASTLHALDKKAGAAQYYGGYLTDPYQVTFKSSNAPAVVKTANMQLPEEQLKALVKAKSDKIKDYFGATIAEELLKNPVEIFESLPNDAKEIIIGFADGTL